MTARQPPEPGRRASRRPPQAGSAARIAASSSRDTVSNGPVSRLALAISNAPSSAARVNVASDPACPASIPAASNASRYIPRHPSPTAYERYLVPKLFAPWAEGLLDMAEVAAGAMMRSPFSGWSTESLRGLAIDAGFDAALVRHQVGGVRFPSVAEFVRQEAASSPLAGTLGAVRGDALEQLVSALAESLAGCIDDEGVAFPVETYMLVARKP